jgi:hypothetical protein
LFENWHLNHLWQNVGKWLDRCQSLSEFHYQVWLHQCSTFKSLSCQVYFTPLRSSISRTIHFWQYWNCPFPQIQSFRFLFQWSWLSRSKSRWSKVE